MEQKKTLSSSSSQKGAVVVGEENKEKVRVIQWEDFDQELARLWSLSSALNEAKQKKLLLQHRLQAALQVPPRVLLYYNTFSNMCSLWIIYCFLNIAEKLES